ncbi:MAG: FAD/NAD(P)-binding oxidoreductase [Cyclobacteriaceae bacterium]
MKNLVIIGAGSAGTMMVNHLHQRLPADWKITVVDPHPVHYYQPGFLFLPFGIYEEKDLYKEKKNYIPKHADYLQVEVDRILPDENKILIKGDFPELHYDLLIVATGSRIAPEEVDGMNGDLWHKSVFDYYSFEGSKALAEKLKTWEGGKLVVHITEMPIKCPVAPLEFAFLADWYFKEKGIRDKVEITYVTPLSGAFTKPRSSKRLGHMLDHKNIKLITDFAVQRIDNDNKKLISWDDKEVSFDLLATVPTNMGDDMIAHSGLGDDLNFVPTNKHTLQSEAHDNIFVIGDATNVPASKAGSVAHFESEILTENILSYINGKPLTESFDGHANCFIETGNGKAMLIDFNYDQEPVEGVFPFEGIGPMKLLEENRMNHWGKLAFRWVYWNMLMKGRKVPFISTHMQKKGKKLQSV